MGHEPEPRQSPDVDFDGTWFNQHGSKMELKVSKAGEVSGRYTTAVGAPGPDEWFGLTGWAADDQIAFAVNFGKYGSLTAWAGQQTSDSEGNAQLVTFWHLTKNVADAEEPKKMWASVLAGSDVFTRTAPDSTAIRRVFTRPSHPIAAKE
jgi:hypothetical protein